MGHHGFVLRPDQQKCSQQKFCNGSEQSSNILESNSFRQIERNIVETREEFLASNFFELLIVFLNSTTEDDPIRKWKVAIVQLIAMVFLHDQTNKTMALCGQQTIEQGLILILHKCNCTINTFYRLIHY